MKKVLSMLTAISMVLCFIAMPVNATESTATEVSTADELLAALAEDKDVIFTKDIIMEATISSGYGITGIIQDGQTIDGNGHSLTVNGANTTWDCAIYTRGGTIKNLTIGGAFRGVFTGGCNEGIILDNVVLDNVCYTFNSDKANVEYSVIIKNSTLNGWTSYTRIYESVVFENCKFGAGTGGYKYAFIRPYSDTTFTNCTFEEGYEFDATRCDNKFIDCMVGNKHLTQESLVDLLGEGAAKATVLAATHKLQEVKEVGATCTEAGMKGYFECQLCGEAWFDEECKEIVNSSEDLVIPATGHTYVDAVCACGHSIKVETEVVAPVEKEEVVTEKVEIKEVTVVEDENTVKAEASVSTEATEIVTAVVTEDEEAVEELVKEEVITKETAENIQKTVEAGDKVVSEIVVEEVKAEEVAKEVQTAIAKEVVEEIHKEAKVAQFLDISVFLKSEKTNETLGTINKLATPITITVAIPDDLQETGRVFYVLRNHDGVVEVLKTTNNGNGTISFTTDQFSTYALAYTDVKEPVKAPATGDNSAMMSYTVMAIAALAVVVVLKKRNSFAK